jgi:hypothetical protein
MTAPTGEGDEELIGRLRFTIDQLRAQRDQLQAEARAISLELLSSHGESQQALEKIDQLQAQLAVAVEGLTFYANKGNYDPGTGDDGGSEYYYAEVVMDNGDTARDALKRIGEGK